MQPDFKIFQSFTPKHLYVLQLSQVARQDYGLQPVELTNFVSKCVRQNKTKIFSQTFLKAYLLEIDIPVL